MNIDQTDILDGQQLCLLLRGLAAQLEETGEWSVEGEPIAVAGPIELRLQVRSSASEATLDLGLAWRVPEHAEPISPPSAALWPWSAPPPVPEPRQPAPPVDPLGLAVGKQYGDWIYQGANLESEDATVGQPQALQEAAAGSVEESEAAESTAPPDPALAAVSSSPKPALQLAAPAQDPAAAPPEAPATGEDYEWPGLLAWAHGPDARAELAQELGVSLDELLPTLHEQDLLRIEGLEPDQAALLVASGVEGIRDLAARDLDELASALGWETPGPLPDWARAARRLPPLP